MTDPKPIPQVPAALVGLYHGARVTSDAYGRRVVGRVTGRTEKLEDADFVAVDFEPSGFGTLPIAETFLLLDGWQPMCHAARWLAGKLGMDPGATAPGWTRVQHNGRFSIGDWRWVLVVDDNEHDFHGEIGNLTDPAEALAAACVAVGGAG
jgi:hypothetical protein